MVQPARGEGRGRFPRKPAVEWRASLPRYAPFSEPNDIGTSGIIDPNVTHFCPRPNVPAQPMTGRCADEADLCRRSYCWRRKTDGLFLSLGMCLPEQSSNAGLGYHVLAAYLMQFVPTIEIQGNTAARPVETKDLWVFCCGVPLPAAHGPHRLDPPGAGSRSGSARQSNSARIGQMPKSRGMPRVPSAHSYNRRITLGEIAHPQPGQSRPGQ